MESITLKLSIEEINLILEGLWKPAISTRLCRD